MHKISGETSKYALYIFQSSSWDCVHFGSSSWDFVHYSKSIMGFFAFSEDPHGILCIFGSSSWHFVHFWNFLMAKHTDVHFILSLFLYKIHAFATYILIDCGYHWLQEELPKMHKIPRGTSKSTQNPTRIFQKCTKSHD
jgi:hypothetical protein